ncbi:retrotransposon ORF1 [Tanacetum coccineum]
MDPHTSIGCLCLGESDRVLLNDKIESEGNWDGPEYQDTVDSGKEREAKAFTFIEWKPRSEKVVKRELLVTLKGGLYFVKFIINLDEDDVEPGVIFGCSFLRLTKGIIDFGSGILTIYPYLITFNDDSVDELDALLASIDDDDLPPIDISNILPFVCNMGKARETKATFEDLQDEPIIETIKYSDQHKKLLDGVLLDKLKLDGEFKVEKEIVGEEFIKGYKAIREKNNPGVFVLPIHLEGKYDCHALVDTGSNINVIPYIIYESLGSDKVKPIINMITILEHSKAEPMGRLLDVLCQVGVTTILASFLLSDIPVDRDVPIVVGRSFLHTGGAIMNTIKGTTSTFDGIVHQKFYVANVRNDHAESDSDDDEEYCLKRDDMGKPIYGLIPLQNAKWIPNRSGNFAKENGDGKWHTKIRVMDPYENIFEQGYETKATDRKLSEHYKLSDIILLEHMTMKLVLLDPREPMTIKSRYNTNLARLLLKQIYSPCIIDWNVLNTLGCAEAIEEMLEIKVFEMGGQEKIFTFEAWRRAFDINEPIYTELCHKFCSTYEFDEVVMDEELITKKLIKFRLGGHRHSLTLLEFARCLGLYHSVEIRKEGFGCIFKEACEVMNNLILDIIEDYWYDKIKRNELYLMNMFEAKHYDGYASVAWLIAKWLKRKGVGSQKESMICYGQFVTRMAKKMNLLTDEVLDGLSAPIYCWSLDATTLRELIDSNGRLII